MMRATRLALSLLIVLLAAPVTGALSTREGRVNLSWETAHAPNIVAAGELHLSGTLRGALVAVRPTGWSLHADQITVGSGGNRQGNLTTYDDATLLVEGGTFLWHLDNDTGLLADVRAPYAIGLALAEAPGNAGAGALLVGSALNVSGSWHGPDTQLTLLDAHVTILQRGAPVAGWSNRSVNPGARADSAPTAGTAFATKGAAMLAGTAQAFGAGTRATTLSVAAASHDGFADAVESAKTLGDLLGSGESQGDGKGGDQGNVFGPNSPLQQLEAISPILNGALILVGADAPEIRTLVSRFGDDPFDVGPFTLMRSKNMAIAWTQDGKMSVQGTPVLVISKQGAAVDPSANLFGIPIISVMLWALALVAIVFFLLRRPQKVDAPWGWRLLGWGAWALAFGLAFWFWDASFATTFGTSFLTVVRAEGLSGATFQNAGVLLGVELIPWTLTSILFALPVRIVLGVALRYLGKGKAFKGFAKAGGLASLAIFAPIYGLFLVNAAVMLGLTLAGTP